jgi:hypothetical protein
VSKDWLAFQFCEPHTLADRFASNQVSCIADEIGFSKSSDNSYFAAQQGFQ